MATVEFYTVFQHHRRSPSVYRCPCHNGLSGWKRWDYQRPCIFCRRKNVSVLEQILWGRWKQHKQYPRRKDTAKAAKRCRPTVAVLDSQSITSDPHGGTVGYDAAKRIKGRKRRLLVDTLGLLLGVEITAADVPEREGARDLLTDVPPWFNWLRKLWVDGGYSGEAFAQWVKTIGPKLEVEVVKRSDTAQGFEVLPRRWVVERTIGWLMRQRRLARDYEATEQSAAAFIFIAMIRIQLRRLA